MTDLVCCGAINWDINLFVDRLPRSGEEVQVREIQGVSGGTAANVAVAAARILGPGRVSLIAALGGDAIAERQLAILGEEGVDASGVLRAMGEESGQAYITIAAGGENEIHTYFGANLGLTAERLRDPERLRLIEGARVAVIMDPPLETAERLAEMCREGGALVVWDPGVYSAFGLEALASTARHIDYIVLNHLEFENLLGTNDPRIVGERLGAVRSEIKAIIKRGSEGCVLAEEGGRTITRVDALPLGRLGMEVVNTVGCGDAFIGAFAAAVGEGLEGREALRRGCAAGSFKATRKETRGGPTRRQLLELLERAEGFRP